MNKKIIFTTGGTGGHIFPAINLDEIFLLQKVGNKIVLVTDQRGHFGIFSKKYSKYKSIINKTSSPTNKNLLKNIFIL